MVELVAEHGYVGVTVRGLSRRAGISSGTLYDHFAGKEDCFFRTYELLMARTARRIAAAGVEERDWQRRLRLAFSALARQIADEPQIGRICFVDALSVGPSALQQTRPAAEMFAGIIRDCFDTPNGIAPPPLLVKGIVAGVAGVVRARLLNGQESELPDLVDDLVEWALCFGEPTAGLAKGRPLGPAPEFEPPAANDAAWPGERASGADRVLIMSAAAQLATSGGYDELSIPRIRAAAGVSRKSFDRHFDDIDDCFLAALELRAKSALGAAARQGASGGNWEDSVHQTISALCAHIARDPVRARTVFVEIFAPGTDGVRRRAKLVDDIAEFVRSGAPRSQRPGKLAAEASVAAVWGILQYHVASGRTHRLRSMAAMLTALVLAPSIGAEAAVEALDGERGRTRREFQSAGNG